MKIRTKQITVTAIMLAICILSQFFKNLSVYITGPIINAALILTVLYAGTVCGIILSIITPVTSFFITGSPIMAAIPAMFPCIMIGNIILVLCVGLLHTKFGAKAGLPVSIGIGAVLKQFHGNLNFSDHSSDIPSGKNAADASRLTAQFSLTQLITAIIGGVYAVIIAAVLKKTNF